MSKYMKITNLGQSVPEGQFNSRYNFVETPSNKKFKKTYLFSK